MNGPQIEFIGNLTHPPRKIQTRDQAQPMTALQIAVNTLRGRDRDPVTQYFSVALWSLQAERALERCQTGTQVFIRGTSNLRQYTREDGSQGYSQDVSAREFRILQRQKGEDQPQPEPDASQPQHHDHAIDEPDFEDFPEYEE